LKHLDSEHKMPDTRDDPLTRAIARSIDAQEEERLEPGRSVYSCPDCGGALWEFDEGFGCHTGHRWAPDELFAGESEALRTALSVAVRVLKERAILTRQLSHRAAPGSESAAVLRAHAESDERSAQLIQTELLNGVDSPRLAFEDTAAAALAALVKEIRRPADD
jgi:two-component system, chemotaxis family, protein-glutamate methylesterase/glutaminase